MKLHIELTNKETEMISNIAMDLGVKEKQVELAKKAILFSYGPVEVISKDGICEIELHPRLTSFILEKVKSMCKYFKGIAKAFVSMIDGMDEVFTDDIKPVLKIEGVNGDEYIKKYFASREEVE